LEGGYEHITSRFPKIIETMKRNNNH
jgi:hypothetical protein